MRQTSSVALRILDTVENTQLLQERSISQLVTGALVFVQSVKDYYVLVKNDERAVDGLDVVAPTFGNARWLRTHIYPSVMSPVRQDWYIDPENGSDENTGESSSPLKTLARWSELNSSRDIKQPTTVHLLSSAPDSDWFVFKGSLVAAGSLILIGTPKVVASGTLQAVNNLATGVSLAQVQWNGGDWTAYVGKRVRITSSATTPAGTIFFVIAAQADPSWAYVSTPYYVDTAASLNPSTTLRILSVGDAFVVEDLPSLGNALIEPTAAAGGTEPRVGVLSCTFASTAITLSLCNTLAHRFSLYGCQVPQYYLQSGLGYVHGCRFAAAFAVTLTMNLGCQFYANLFPQGMNLWSGVRVDFLFDNTFQKTVTVYSGIIGINNIGNRWGANWREWSGAALSLSGGNAELDSVVWGTSSVADSFAIEVKAGSTLGYHASRTPTISGAAAYDIDIGFAQDTYGNLSVAGQNPNNNNAWMVIRKT